MPKLLLNSIREILNLISIAKNKLLMSCNKPNSLRCLMLILQSFYEDLFEELSKYGEIESLNICDNLADHMVNIFSGNLCLPLFLFYNLIFLLFESFSVDRLATCMFSLERKNMLQMHSGILAEDIILVRHLLSFCISIFISIFQFFIRIARDACVTMLCYPFVLVSIFP